MKTAFCNELFEPAPLEQALDTIASAGYDAVELAPFTLRDDAAQLSAVERAALVAAVDKSGLEVAGLHWLLVKPEGLHLSTPDAAVRERTVCFLEELIRLNGDLGGKVLIWGSPKMRSIAPDQDRGEVTRWMVEYLARLAACAASCGSVFCIEPLSCDQTNYINHPDEAADLIAQAGYPAGLGMILDAYSSNRDGIDIVAQLRRHLPLVYHLHVNDTNKQGPGMGTYDFAPLVQTAKVLDYHGYISVEAFDGTPGVETIAHQSRQYLRQCGI